MSEFPGGMSFPDIEHNDVGDTFMGHDVNDFVAETTYGIFNDPDDADYSQLPEALRQQVLETAFYTDESLDRAIKHLRLTNEDRTRLVPPRGPAVLKEQTVLRTPWKKIDVG